MYIFYVVASSLSLNSTAFLGRFSDIILETGGNACIVIGNHGATFSSHVSRMLNHKWGNWALIFQGEQNGEPST